MESTEAAGTPERQPTLYEWAGGLPAFRRLTRVFYDELVLRDPLLQPLFASMPPDHPEKVAAWFAETFGGPADFTERHGGYDHMVAQHEGRALTEEQRARWAHLMSQAADMAELPADPEFRSAFVAYIEWGSRIAWENSQPDAHPPRHLPVPRWDWGCAGPPGGRSSALADGAEQDARATGPSVAVPAADQQVRFALHIKPLFRAMDRQSMSRAFDLWSHPDVVEHAGAILERLQGGSMPCDGAWPPEQVEVFKRWLASGAAP